MKIRNSGLLFEYNIWTITIAITISDSMDTVFNFYFSFNIPFRPLSIQCNSNIFHSLFSERKKSFHSQLVCNSIDSKANRKKSIRWSFRFPKPISNYPFPVIVIFYAFQRIGLKFFFLLFIQFVGWILIKTHNSTESADFFFIENYASMSKHTFQIK